MDHAPDVLRALLRELADWLEFEQSPAVDWVVCGGMAMALQGLRARATRDIDVLGEWDPVELSLVQISTFPTSVARGIERVIEAHPELAGLGSRWVNLGAQKLAEWGLPKGFQQRMVRVEFGRRLTLHVLGRIDLIALKLFAASDDHGPRRKTHYQDLQSFRPTFDELDAGLEWLRTLPAFEQVRPIARETVRELGFDDLAYYV